MYTKPATTFNPELTRKYGQNIFSVMEEVWASDKERIDVVIFLNGLAIISFELKCNTAGQSYQDAIYQYRTERNPKTRLFLVQGGLPCKLRYGSGRSLYDNQIGWGSYLLSAI